MSLNQLPTNRNFLNPTGFAFAINRLPGVVMNCQMVRMPKLHLDPIMTPNPFNKLDYSATSADYGLLTIQFKVDEDLVNYREIFDWMVGLGFPENFRQYRELKENSAGNAGLRSDASLIIYTSEKNANIEVVFRDVFPTDIEIDEMVTTNDDPKYVTATATFALRDYVLRVVNEPISS